jgi:hypothetical protein
MTVELEVRVARMVVPARGVQDRQAVLPGPLQAFHRALLGAFLAGAGPPDRSVVGQLAAELALEPRAALAVLAAADLVRTDPATSRVSVAYPFSAVPASHRVELAGTAAVGDACSRVADCCCPHINFHASPRDADDYRRAHPALAAELLDQAEAIEAARRSFAGLLRREPGDDPAGHRPPDGQMSRQP